MKEDFTVKQSSIYNKKNHFASLSHYVPKDIISKTHVTRNIIMKLTNKWQAYF